MSLALSDDVKSQDSCYLVAAVANYNEGRDLAWAFVKDNWAEFDKRYGPRGGGQPTVSVSASVLPLDRVAYGLGGACCAAAWVAAAGPSKVRA